MSENKNHTYSSVRTTALTLPFFEDFTGYGANPDSSKWLERQVYINNTMGVNMISRGVATFDALSQFGVPYDTTNPYTIRYADSLSSKVIDLSTFLPSDSIYFSFFYQAGGNGFAPEKPDSLMLFFKPKTGTVWTKVWAKSDSALSPFIQVMIPISDSSFLHSNFQFRFINKASVGINDDVWNVDYIRIASSRNKFDTLVNDIAFTTTPSSILKDYVSLPYRQYLAAASAERATTFQSSVKNNINSTQLIPNYGFTTRELYSGASLAANTGTNINIAANNTVDIIFSTYTSTPAAGAYDKVVFENQYYTQTPMGDISKTNDTIISQQVFDNYLAYDDGTAEMSYFLNLFPTLPGKIAIEHHLNQADTLRGLAVYFGRQLPLASYKYFSIVVYKSIAYGASTTDSILYQIDNLQPKYLDTVNHFWVYKFDKPIALRSGTFFIGTTQPALSGSDSLYFGIDRNRKEGNHTYFNVLNVWNPSLVSGAIMMRPLLGQAITGSGINELSVSSFVQFIIAPNPSKNTLKISTANFEKNTHYEVFNALGATILSGNMDAQEQDIDIHALSDGIYYVQLIAPNYKYKVQKLIKE
ncbi:MAG: T9SS type A sorting domain-containing protein [Phycisphaerales bacterium]|nr:T9SS type A sorting domain-containing protein [Phycisphaerales bacterium]